MFKLVDNEGKPINTEGVDPKVLAVVTAAVGGVGHQTTAAINASINNAIKPVSDKLAEFGTTIESLKTAKPGDPDPKAGDPKVGDETPGWAKKLMEEVGTLKGDLSAQKQKEAVTALGESWLKENAPNLKPEQRQHVMRRIVAAAPKDADGVKGVFDEVKAEYLAFGGDAVGKAFSAEPVKEGAADDDPDKDKQAEQKTLDSLKESLAAKRA